MKKLLNTLIPILVAALSGLSVNHFADKTHKEVEGRYELINHLPLSSLDRKIVNIILLGQSELYDDFAHIWTTQYLGSEEILELDPELVLSKIQDLMHLNLQSESFYLFTCYRFIFHFKRPDLCEPIGIEASKILPESWMITAALGFAYLVQNKFSEAAVIFDATGQKANAPKYFKTVGKKILEKNNVDFQLNSEILEALGDDETTRRIMKKFQGD